MITDVFTKFDEPLFMGTVEENGGFTAALLEEVVIGPAESDDRPRKGMFE